MVQRARKSSACVTLVLLGTAALTGCGDDNDAGKRRQYATREACVADWGDPAECEAQETRDSTGASHYTYFGGQGGGGGHGGGTGIGHDVSRGGFGANGHAHSAGS
jgi:hypothetical protein